VRYFIDYCGLSSLAHYLHRVPVVVKLRATVEAHDVVTAGSNRFPVGVAIA